MRTGCRGLLPELACVGDFANACDGPCAGTTAALFAVSGISFPRFVQSAAGLWPCVLRSELRMRRELGTVSSAGHAKSSGHWHRPRLSGF
jgi:hypothetical protein